ncbi:metastasis-suppressor KiSS-1 [Xyrauchen texanus]|uniref:metastasis-suppressor KiSS-1 n=1 Tax=Xyrauchen texanus TaxID=154827 RepID=UPI0022423A07|nr:metastasis-suppressor KiSS-1 [Xyrauchen texanus]
MNHRVSTSKRIFHTCKCTVCKELNFATNQKMMLLIILVLSVSTGDSYPSRHFQYFEDGTPEETALRVLRGTNTRQIAPKISAHFLKGITNPVLSAGSHQSAWGWSPDSSYTKRRQNVAYYNLNSFGLRYGKREQKILASFEQSIK